MKKKLKCKKALSPVIAAIILIAVTVAVSIAVAAWMGALTIGMMGGAEQLNILEVRFPTNTTVTVEVKNAGASAVVIEEIRIDAAVRPISSVSLNIKETDGKYTIDKGKSGILTVSFTWDPGIPYEISVKTTKQIYQYPATAPS